MKSIVAFLKGLMVSIVEDAKHTFPTELAMSLERDKSRLLTLVENRGLSFLTIDLPAFGKHFDKCLSNCVLVPSNVPGFGTKDRTTPIPRLFSGMMYRIFDEDGCLVDSADPNSVLFVRQLCYFAKKYRIECDESRKFEAVKEFSDAENQAYRSTLYWDGDLLSGDTNACRFSDNASRSRLQLTFGPDILGKRSVQLESSLEWLDRVCGRIISGFAKPSIEGLSPRHGPGAVSDQGSGGYKFDFPTWPWKLEALFPYDTFAFANMSLASGEGEDTISFRAEPASKLISVPKTQKSPRLIASEPTAHQYIQQGLKAQLVSCVDRSLLSNCINFLDQSLNANDALEASLTGERVTIDLSAASDRLSLWTVERVFSRHPQWLEAMHAARTRTVKQNLDCKQPSLFRLRKFAAMGSALTFPVESICFALISIAAVMAAREMSNTHDSYVEASKLVRVFGDDLIVPKDVSGVLIELIEHLGLKVNLSKTHLEGNFRESCGLDAFAGVNVTPAYVLDTYDESRPTTLASTVESSNNFHIRGFWRAADYLRSTLPEKVLKLLPVVNQECGAFGLTSFVGSKVSHLKKRENHELHRKEYRVVFLSDSTRRVSVAGWSPLLQYYTERPGPENLWQSGRAATPRPTIRSGWKAEQDLQ